MIVILYEQIYFKIGNIDIVQLLRKWTLTKNRGNNII